MNRESEGGKSTSAIESRWNICVERRRHTRYPLQIKTVFVWRDQGSKRYHDSGFTRDVSIRGLFILRPLPLQLGTAISLEVTLPALEPGTPGLRLTFDGVVTRTVDSTDGAGFVVVGDFRPHMSALDV